IQASAVRENSFGGLPTAQCTLFLNGGILQATANNATYIQDVFCMVMSNSFVLDDNGFTLNINDPLLDGDGLGGGFIKRGVGTVYLDSPNFYTGTTLVTNGILAGVGIIQGRTVIAPSALIGAGDPGIVGTLTINSNLLVQGGATMRVNKTGGTPS